jgi:uncharacterized protein
MEIRYLILARTTRCNLRCRYCYNADQDRTEDMPVAVMQKAMDLAGTGGRPFHLQLTGGEPTLVPELVAAAAKLAISTGRCRSMGIQTNATCLTPELLSLLKRAHVQVGVSLDGPPAVHEHQRGRAATTLRGIQQLESARIPFRVTTVVTRINAECLDELVLSLAGFSMARGIGLDLLVCKGRAQQAGEVAPVDRQTLEKGLQRMHAMLVAVNSRREVPIQWREWELIFPDDGRPKHRSGFCHASLGQSLAAMPNGRLFPCGQTLGDSRFSAGTVWEPQDGKLTPLRTCRPQQAGCSTCELATTCPGDCPSRLHYNQNRNPTLACHLYRTLYQMGNRISENQLHRGTES